MGVRQSPPSYYISAPSFVTLKGPGHQWGVWEPAGSSLRKGSSKQRETMETRKCYREAAQNTPYTGETPRNSWGRVDTL